METKDSAGLLDISPPPISSHLLCFTFALFAKKKQDQAWLKRWWRWGKCAEFRQGCEKRVFAVVSVDGSSCLIKFSHGGIKKKKNLKKTYYIEDFRSSVAMAVWKI